MSMIEERILSHSIAQRAAQVRERIAHAARRGGRPANAVTLIAVTKTMSAETIRAARLAGIEDVGENKVQEAGAKMAVLADEPQLRWHLIGHLQKNKARRAVELFGIVHSIDSLDLAEAMGRHAAERERTIDLFAQVNISGEASKSGFAPETLLRQADALARLEHVRWRGLMTIAPDGAAEETLRDVFARTRKLHERLANSFQPQTWNALSMGMTNDFELAIEEGATHVRVGRAIFGERTGMMQA